MKLKQNKAKMYRIIGERDEQQLKEVLNLINLRKNGTVVDSMKAAGLTYKVSFGVSVVDMRTLVRPYKNNNVLAGLLWGKGWRETYMAATMIANADTIDAKVLLKWAEEIPNYEVAEQFGNNLLAGHNSGAVFKALLKDTCNLKRMTAYKAFARRFLLKNLELKDSFLDSIGPTLLMPLENRKQMVVALGQAMGFLSRHDKDVIPELLNRLNSLIVGCEDFKVAREILKTEMPE